MRLISMRREDWIGNGLRAVSAAALLAAAGCTSVDTAAMGVAGMPAMEVTGTVPSLAPMANAAAAIETDGTAGMTLSEDGEPAQAVDAIEVPPEAAQPRIATYTCTGGEEFTVEHQADAVVVASGGDSIALPAAPPGQHSRFAENAYALVLDGDEAMWMAGRKQPATCRRPGGVAVAGASAKPSGPAARPPAAQGVPQGR